MAISSDSSLRNRLISKQLDAGRRKTDATSDNAADATEAVESPINTFAQAPSSADRLREHQSPLDELLKPNASEPINGEIIDGIDAEISAGDTAAGIDGHFGPKTLEARNLFDQDQVDALKMQTNNPSSMGTRASLEQNQQLQSKQAVAGIVAGKEALSGLSNASAKSVQPAQRSTVDGPVVGGKTPEA